VADPDKENEMIRCKTDRTEEEATTLSIQTETEPLPFYNNG